MRGGICGHQLYSSTEINTQLPISQIKMPITTCQKVTLISCSVLCVSLFLPRIFLPARKKEMEQPGGKSVYQIIIHHHSAPSLSICACVCRWWACCSDNMNISLLYWQKVLCVFVSVHCIPVCPFVNVPFIYWLIDLFILSFVFFFMFSPNRRAE